MTRLRSERLAALLLFGAAVLALIVANSPIGEAVMAFMHAHFGVPQLGLDLSVAHWITDGLLAIFFLIAAIELKHELKHGALNSPRRALVPAVAAVGGVLAPALLFLIVVGGDPELALGWPIPTATDIAFALGVLAIVGRGLPAGIRVLLLALAVIDDLIAIIIIAAFFTTDLAPIPLLLAVPAVLLFGWVSYRARGAWVLPVLILLGVITWYLVLLSGIHATIAGVALGLVIADSRARRARHAIEPWSNVVILPVFAFAAALVAFPAMGIAELSPAFWGVAVALPVGKLIGITAGALIAMALAGRGNDRIAFVDLLVVAGLGGIGFTVSLLMNELAFESLPLIADEVTLAVLAGSLASAVIGTVLALTRSRVLASRTPSSAR